MSMKTHLSQERVKALKEKNLVRKAALVSVLSAITQFEKDNRTALVNGAISDEQVLKIIEKAIKQRKDSISQYEKADRQDLVEQEAGEMQVLQEFMPQQMSEDEVVEVVKSAISEVGATEMKQMGAVIGKIRPQLAGKADMAMVSKLVKSFLS